MKYKTIAAAAFSVFIASCSSNPTSSSIALSQMEAYKVQKELEEKRIKEANEKLSSSLEEIPEWYLTPITTDPNNIYGTGVGDSSKLNIAVQKSKLLSDYNLAKNVSAIISGEETINYDVDDNESNRSVVDLFVNNVDVSQVKTIKRHVVVRDGKYFVYTLTAMPKSAIYDKDKYIKSLMKDKRLDESYKRLLKRVNDSKRVSDSK